MKKLLSVILIALMFFINVHPVQAKSPIELNSRYAYLFDRETGMSYIDQSSHDKMYPASMTKVFTVSMALKKINNIHQTVRMEMQDFEGLFAAGASMAGFQPEEKVTYEDLLYGALLPSGADACNALARLTYGSVQGMVDAMNEELKTLGLTSSHFMNVTGLHDDNHYTTAYDMAMILNDALKNKEFQNVFHTRTYTDSKKRRTFQSTLQRSGTMMNEDTTMISGAKSGYTDEAQLTLASQMSVEGHDLILVTAYAKGQRSHKHVIDALNVYKYMTDNFKTVKIYNQGDKITEFMFLNSQPLIYQYKMPQDVELLISRTLDEKNIQRNIQKNYLHWMPLKKGGSLGSISIEYNNQPLYEWNMVLNENIEFSLMHSFFEFVLPIIVLLAIIYAIKRLMISRS